MGKHGVGARGVVLMVCLCITAQAHAREIPKGFSYRVAENDAPPPDIYVPPPDSPPPATETVPAAPPPASPLLETVEKVSNILSGPALTLPFFTALMAVGSAMEDNNLKFGTFGVFSKAFFWGGLAGIPLSYVLPFLYPPEKFDPEYVPRTTLSNQVYLLDLNKKSALTGQLRRQPSSGIGSGLGWDFALETVVPMVGFVYGGALTYQRTTIAANDWAALRNMFVKVDAHVGWNALSMIGDLVHSTWLGRQELSLRVGPSFFSNWVSVADEGSGLFTDAGKFVNMKAPLVNGFGYELWAQLAIDFGLFGALTFSYQRGDYPVVNMPEISADNSALLVLVGFDDLRSGKRYTWERYRAELAVPFTGFGRSGTINLGVSQAKYQSSAGASVNNRGLSLGGSWRF